MCEGCREIGAMNASMKNSMSMNECAGPIRNILSARHDLVPTSRPPLLEPPPNPSRRLHDGWARELRPLPALPNRPPIPILQRKVLYTCYTNTRSPRTAKHASRARHKTTRRLALGTRLSRNDAPIAVLYHDRSKAQIKNMCRFNSTFAQAALEWRRHRAERPLLGRSEARPPERTLPLKFNGDKYGNSMKLHTKCIKVANSNRLATLVGACRIFGLGSWREPCDSLEQCKLGRRQKRELNQVPPRAFGQAKPLSVHAPHA